MQCRYPQEEVEVAEEMGVGARQWQASSSSGYTMYEECRVRNPLVSATKEMKEEFNFVTRERFF